MITHLDLFSGIGGFSLAARWIWGDKHRPVAFVEREPFCQSVLKKHWPDVPIIGDIKNVEAIEHVCQKQLIHIVTGGFPCQPFSLAGSRKGASDDRYLWPEMRQIIEVARPTWVLCENVAGIESMVLDRMRLEVESRSISRTEARDLYEAVLSRQEKMLLAVVCQDLEDLGYEVQPLTVPACAVNAPHRRDRMWIVGYSELSEWRQKTSRGDNTYRDNAGREEAASRTGKSGETMEHSAGARCRTREQGEMEAPRDGARMCEPERRGCYDGHVADAESERCGKTRKHSKQSEEWIAGSGNPSLADAAQQLPHGTGNTGARRRGEYPDGGIPMGDSCEHRLQGRVWGHGGGQDPSAARSRETIEGSGDACWRDAGWLIGADGKARRVHQSRFRGVANGISSGMDAAGVIPLVCDGKTNGRVARLKALGNAIVPQVAAMIMAAIRDADNKEG